MNPTAAFFCNLSTNRTDFESVFPSNLRCYIAAQTKLVPEVVTPENFETLAHQLRDVEVIFATWGTWEFSPIQLEALPNLKAVFYAAGTVKHFATPLLERGVIVTSAYAANAIPVAEFTLGQILLANKGYFRNVREFGERPEHGVFRGRGNYGAAISILGVGQVGSQLIELLRPFHFDIAVFDPFLSYEAAELLRVEKVETLEEAFACGDIVSNHLADVPETTGILNGTLFASMKENATFINTGRGPTIKSEEMLEVFCKRADLTALLDVTDPEPLPINHPLRALPNVHISGHIAGSIGNEVRRLADLAVEEFEQWRVGKPPRYAISLSSLAITA